MRNVFLSVVVVCALVITGIGGTLAGLSDTESSVGNYMAMGSLDLEISPDGDNWYDDDADNGYIRKSMVKSGLHWPCQWTEPAPFYLHSKSEPDGKVANAYISLKDFSCSDIKGTKPGHKDGTTEPEDAEALGGYLANQQLCDWEAKACAFSHLVEVNIYWDKNGDGTLQKVRELVAGPVLLSDLWDPDCATCVCWIDLGEILACNTGMGWISMHIIQLTQAEAWANDQGGWLTDDNVQLGGALYPDDGPFDGHYTNAFQLDKCEFEMIFALTQDEMNDDSLYPCVEN